MEWMDGISLSLLNKDLDGLWAKQRAITNNISNSETPGYKSESISFEGELKKILSDSPSTASELTKAIRDAKVTRTVSQDQSLRADGNNVDLEAENVELARTQLNYLASLQQVSDQFTRLRCVITGGNG